MMKDDDQEENKEVRIKKKPNNAACGKASLTKIIISNRNVALFNKEAGGAPLTQ